MHSSHSHDEIQFNHYIPKMNKRKKNEAEVVCLTQLWHFWCSGDPARARGLPSNIPIGDLQSQKTEFIAPTHDMGNPNLSSEIFDTRQACSSCKRQMYGCSGRKLCKRTSGAYSLQIPLLIAKLESTRKSCIQVAFSTLHTMRMCTLNRIAG